MMLLNRTGVPDAALAAVLVASGRRVGARTARVVVQVNRAQGPHSSGVAWECCQVKWPGPRGSRLIWRNTDGGAFKISLPKSADALEAARRFYLTAAHEWCHVREYQLGGRSRFTFSDRGAGKRRPRHRDRPEESRVRQRLRETAEEGRDENRDADAILALALAIEAADAARR